MIGQTLLVKRGPINLKYKNVVGIYEEDSIVRHVPYNLAHYHSILARDAFAEITGGKVNREHMGEGYGLDIPCMYSIYGPKTT